MSFNDYMIKEIRHSLLIKGISYDDLISKVGSNRDSIKRFLYGKRAVKNEDLICILKALDMDIVDLVNKYKDKEKSPLEIRINGELKERATKREFEKIVFAIEDYVDIKQS